MATAHKVEGVSSVRGTPSTGQGYGLMAAHLAIYGRLTLPQAARLCAGYMLGDWNTLAYRERKKWMDTALMRLKALSFVMPIYDLHWVDLRGGYGGKGKGAYVWYYSGREPSAYLKKDLARAGSDAE